MGESRQPRWSSGSRLRTCLVDVGRPPGRAPWDDDAENGHSSTSDHASYDYGVPSHPPTNLQLLAPSRRNVREGDIFTMQLPDSSYLFGRVVRTDADCFAPGCILIYIFSYRETAPLPPRGLLVRDLLIPPRTINRLGWSRGYFQTIGNRAFEDGERLAIHYFKPNVRRTGGPEYVDEDGRSLASPPDGVPVGSSGLGNYRTVDDEISDALGIPPAPE